MQKIKTQHSADRLILSLSGTHKTTLELEASHSVVWLAVFLNMIHKIIRKHKVKSGLQHT
jgi:hypothetical protein